MLTNFDTLTYIFIAMTMGTLMYPKELFFRSSITNILSIVILTLVVIYLKVDISNVLTIEILTTQTFVNGFSMIFGLSVLTIFGLRLKDDLSSIDTFFMGILPYSLFFALAFGLMKINMDHVDLMSFVVMFFIGYAVFTYKKLKLGLFFSVKRMGDQY